MTSTDFVALLHFDLQHTSYLVFVLPLISLASNFDLFVFKSRPLLILHIK